MTLGVVSATGGGCQLPHQPPAAATRQEPDIRVNCYSLLHHLLDQQRNVDKLLLVKLESAELHRVIKLIADASGAAADQLKAFAKDDPSIRLDRLGLPPGEVATRDAIASTKTKKLLTPFNSNFELNLLLTQSEALSYGWHLAKVAAAHETHPNRSSYLENLSDRLKRLHGEVISLMRSRLTAAGPTGNSLQHQETEQLFFTIN